jgi:beta-lactamase superfamily II metal-dependent hydrolase
LLKLIVVQAEYGDCLLLESSDGNKSKFILIDGGPSQTYEKNLKPTLDTILASKNLDLIILSHIDNDHVLGLLDLFEAIKSEKDASGGALLNVNGLWHNSFSDILGTKLDSNRLVKNLFSSKRFSFIKGEDFITKLPALGALKGVSEGRDVTKLAEYLNVPINAQFGGNPIVVRGEEFKIIEAGNMKFHILGPTQKNLDRLKKVWDDWENSHTEAEVIHDYVALNAIDSSISNLSSIMFLAELEGKKILFTGDGLADDIIDSLSEKQMLNSEGRLHVDILKVPHHGSERNVSKHFFDTVTADTYVISANGRDDNPSFSTLKWIIESGKKNYKKITIVATNKTENIERAQQLYDPKKFGYRFKFLNPQKNFLVLDS